MVHIHPMSLCLLLPWAAVLVVFSGGWMRRNWLAPAVSLVGAGIACAPYLLTLFQGDATGDRSRRRPATPLLSGLLEPKLFTGWPLVEGLPELFRRGCGMPREALLATVWVSSLAYAACALGAIASARALWAAEEERSVNGRRPSACTLLALAAIARRGRCSP
jgi:hypothetical protein